MIVPFRLLPGATRDVARPLVDLAVDGLDELPQTCLVDTGSLHNRFAAWVARVAGIDLAGAATESIGVGGRPTIARTVTVGLRLGETRWDAPVSFCDPWPWDFHLAGQEGFLRWFRLVIDAADRVMEITPATKEA